MKTFVILCLAGVAFSFPNYEKDVKLSEGRIIGGEEAPKHEFPWQVSLKSLGSHICGGSIVNKMQVITAAHCCQGQLAFADQIVAGAHDICMITLKEPFNLDDPNVQPIEFFQTSDAEIPAETVCNSTGWGLTNGNGLFLPNHLQWIQIPVHSREDCESIFPGYITDNMVCAGSAGAATCNGDSGGPLVCPDESGNGKLAGIVSFGYTGCTDAGVYAKVSSFTDWIMERWVDA